MSDKFKKPAFYFNDTFKMNYYFYLGWPVDALKKYLRYDPPGIEHSSARTIEWQREDGVVVIHIWTRKKSDLASLVHECVHAAGMTLNRAGVKGDWLNDEPHAYLTEAIFKNATQKNKE